MTTEPVSSDTSVVAHDISEKAVEVTAPSHELDTAEHVAEQNPQDEKTLVDGEDGSAKESGAPLDRTPSQAQKMSRKNIVLVMVALCMATFLAALDMTIVSTALPTIADKFNASESGYSWIASSYLLANAACIPLWGKISDIWGRKPIILMANVLFLVGSLVCALAKSLAMIIAGRAIQGIGGGGIIILANISVTDLFSMRERPMYYGLFGATWAIASALGPIIGGAFTTDVTWRWCFYLNLPIGGVSLAILFLFLHIETPKTPLIAGLRTIDWIGTFLIIGGTLMFLFGLEFGGVNYPWASASVICLIIFGVVVWVLAFFAEWKIAKYPIIPLRLFTEWYNVLILMICFCHGFVFISGTYYLPFYFQTVLLASPIMSGVYLLPLVLALSVVSAGTGVLMRKTGRYREFIMAGLFFMTLGFGLLIDLKPYASWPRIIIFQLIAGIGVGPNFQAPLVAFQANVRPADMATATATFGFVRQLATSMSIVMGTVVYQNMMSQQSAELTAAVGASITETISSSFAGSSKALIEGLTTSQREVVLKAFTFALSRMWIMYTAVAGIGFILSCFIRPLKLSKAHTIHKTGLAEQERARQELANQERNPEDNLEAQA
ncbi:Efflux pump dotC [Penicillium malachiteum]|uniref:Efflux pump dotC n=1 Tax=Penicillium malachiteum TaxID=1324776 RepID=A0AAD6HBC5_9EURO|nr:Efflux pump dotC [Penicillium malachiteum]